MSEPSAPRRITSAARVAAYHLLDANSPVTERRLAAVVDGAACLIDHAGAVTSARLLLQVVAPAAVAEAALATLTEGGAR